MSDTAYSLAAAAWSVVGFASGYSAARLQTSDYLRTRGRGQRMTAGGNGKPHRNPRLAIVLIVLGLATAGQGIYFSWERGRQADCQAVVDARLLESLNASTKASKEYRDQTNEIWRYVLTAGAADRAQVRQRFEAYLASQEQQEKRRAAVPLPSASDLERC